MERTSIENVAFDERPLGAQQRRSFSVGKLSGVLSAVNTADLQRVYN